MHRHKAQLIGVAIALIVAVGLNLTASAVFAQQASPSPTPTPSDGLAQKLEKFILKAIGIHGQDTQETDGMEVSPADIARSGIEYLGILDPEDPTAVVVVPDDKIFPGDTIVLEVYNRNDHPEPLDDAEMQLRYPVFTSVVTGQPAGAFGIGDGVLDDVRQTVTWALPVDQQATKTPIVRRIALKLEDTIPFGQYTKKLEFEVVSRSKSLNKELASKKDLDLWGRIEGQIEVFDDFQSAEGQPLSGVSLALVVDQEEVDIPNPENAVPDKDGLYTIDFPRHKITDSLGLYKYQVRISYVTPKEKYEQIKDIGMKFYRVHEELERFDDSIRQNDATTDQLAIATYYQDLTGEGKTKLDIDIQPLAGQVSRPQLVLPDSNNHSAKELEAALNGAAVWKNLWLAINYTETNLGVQAAGKWDIQKPLRVYFHDGDVTMAPRLGGQILMGADVWGRTAIRSGQNAELHEFGHVILYSLGSHSSIGKKSLNSLSSSGLAKIPEIPSWGNPNADYQTGIEENHAGWLNDRSADSLHEGFADFYAMYIDNRINGDPNPNCRYCYHQNDGSVMHKPTPRSPMSQDQYWSSKAKALNINSRPILNTDMSEEQRTVYNLLLAHILGPDAAWAHITNQDLGWTKEPSSPTYQLFPPVGSEELSITRFVAFLRWVTLVGEQADVAGLVDWMRQERGSGLKPEGSADTMALGFGMFADENCNYKFDPGEEIGKIANYQGLEVRVRNKRQSVTRDFYGARPWRTNDQIPVGQYVKVEQANITAGQPVRLTVSIEYAAPFEAWSYKYQTATTGGLVPLVLPDASFNTRAVISVGDQHVPVLVIDSDDYWQALNNDVIPDSVAQITLASPNPQPITVPAWPADLTVAATQDPVEYHLAVSDPEAGAIRPNILPQSAPAGTTPSASPTAAEDDQKLSTIAGEDASVQLAGFAAPQTVSIKLGDKEIGSQRILTHQAEVAVLLPSDTRAGEYTLTITGQAGEKATVPVLVAAAKETTDRTKNLLAMVGLVLLTLIVAVALLRQGKRLAAIVLVLAACGYAGQATAQTDAPSTDYPYFGRRSDFVQLVPSRDERLYLMKDFGPSAEQYSPQDYFGRPELVCFIQRLADNWTKKYPDEILKVNDMSYYDNRWHTQHPGGGHVGGNIVDLWSVSRSDHNKIKILNGVDESNYDAKMADDFGKTIRQSVMEIDLRYRNHWPTVYFNPPDGKQPTGTQPLDHHDDHWHIDMTL